MWNILKTRSRWYWLLAASWVLMVGVAFYHTLDQDGTIAAIVYLLLMAACFKLGMVIWHLLR